MLKMIVVYLFFMFIIGLFSYVVWGGNKKKMFKYGSLAIALATAAAAVLAFIVQVF